jgi:hypothetical protein
MNSEFGAGDRSIKSFWTLCALIAIAAVIAVVFGVPQ